MDPSPALAALGPETLDNLAQALWLPTFDAAQVPPDILERLLAEKNSNIAFGERTRARLNDLLAHPDSFSPDYRARYEGFLKSITALTPHQAHVITELFGSDANLGFKSIPDHVQLQFPQDHYPDLQASAGWYYIVGSCTDDEGVEYGVLILFYRAALLSPPLAASYGLTDLENQVADLHIGINRGTDEHYQAVPLCIAGTTGLVQFGLNPFRAAIGKNEIVSLDPSDLFPLHLHVRGWDRGKAAPVELEADLTFSSGKGIMLQGKDGVLSIGGVGTPYYSIPNLVLDSTASRLRIGGTEIHLREGQFWLDHQWGVFGNTRPEVLRAVSNLAPAYPGGWDWFELQFDGDRQISVVGMHSHDNLPYYFQEGPTPPGVMNAHVTGKFMDEHGQTLDAVGTLTISDWLKNDATPDPAQYWSTTTWYPNRWEFHFDAPVAEDLRNIVLLPLNPKGSLLFFNSGAQYQEAPVHILDAGGRRVGRGYAESVLYANTNKNRLALAGLPETPELLETLKTPETSGMSKILSAVYALAHRAELASAVPPESDKKAAQ